MERRTVNNRVGRFRSPRPVEDLHLLAHKNARRGLATAGIARKWEGERRVRPPMITLAGDQQDTLPDGNDLRFRCGGGKWILCGQSAVGGGQEEEVIGPVTCSFLPTAHCRPPT